MRFEVTIIGSGDTLGTPVAGSNYPSDLDEKSKRFRFGLLIEIDGTKILIDASPDLKWQALNSKFELKDIDYVLVTNSHSDHLNGMGEFFYRRQVPTKVYSLDNPLIQKHLDYFRYLENEKVLVFETCQPFVEFELSEKIKVVPVELNHGFPAVGYVIYANNKKIAIITDSNAQLPGKTLEYIKDVDFLFIDSFSEDMKQVEEVFRTCNEPVPADIQKEWFHMTFAEVKQLALQVNAKKTYPVHISRFVAPHLELVQKHETESFVISFDGLKIDCLG